MTDAKFAHLSVGEIHVAGNIRKHFDEEKLAELAASIAEYGVIEPLIVRVEADIEAQGGRYELVAGERRLRAARIAGLDRVPVRVMTLTREQAAKIQLVENLQRQDLDPIEEASGFRALIDEHGYTQETLAAELGVSQPHIANRLALLRLPEEVQENISRGILSATAGRELLRLERWPKLLVAAASEVAEREMSSRQVPGLVERTAEGHGRNITKDGYWPHPQPVFDVAGCKNCDDRWKRAQGQGGYLCINHHCWDQKQAKAQREIQAQEESKRRQQTPESPATAGVPGQGLEDVQREAVARQKAALERFQAIIKKAGTPAPALKDADQSLAEELRDAVVQHPYNPHVWTNSGEGDFWRECFLPLGQLLQHFRDRQGLGATSMPAEFGAASVVIPEQGVEFHGSDGYGGRGSEIVLKDVGVQIWTPGGSVLELISPRTFVYYRVAIVSLSSATCYLHQWMAVRGHDRTIVVRASASVTAQRDIKTKMLKLINQLPGYPGKSLCLPPAKEEGEEEDAPPASARLIDVLGEEDDDIAETA